MSVTSFRLTTFSFSKNWKGEDKNNTTTKRRATFERGKMYHCAKKSTPRRRECALQTRVIQSTTRH